MTYYYQSVFGPSRPFVSGYYGAGVKISPEAAAAKTGYAAPLGGQASAPGAYPYAGVGQTAEQIASGGQVAGAATEWGPRESSPSDILYSNTLGRFGITGQSGLTSRDVTGEELEEARRLAQQYGLSEEAGIELAMKQQVESQKANIESGYGEYFRELDAILGEDLPAQRAAQEEIVRGQYGQGEKSLGMQREEGLGLMEKERTRTEEAQARNLRDLATMLKNSFMAGNVYLGSRGAGDSSAAKQYSYALTKLGSRQRGDVMRQTSDILSEIADREAKIQNIYTGELSRMASERDQKIMEIASWFAEQQQAIRTAKAQGQISKGQDLASLSQTLLNDALSKLSVIRQEESNRRLALDQWALNNTAKIDQTRSDLQEVQEYSPTIPGVSQPVGQIQTGPQGDIRVPGYSGVREKEEEERTPLFGSFSNLIG